MSDLIAQAALVEADMVARGVPQGTAEATVSHALNWSLSIAKKVSPDMRERVAADLFRDAIQKTKYLDAMQEFIASGE